jgi:hypothetical protein
VQLVYIVLHWLLACKRYIFNALRPVSKDPHWLLACKRYLFNDVKWIAAQLFKDPHWLLACKRYLFNDVKWIAAQLPLSQTTTKKRTSVQKIDVYFG